MTTWKRISKDFSSFSLRFELLFEESNLRIFHNFFICLIFASLEGNSMKVMRMLNIYMSFKWWFCGRNVFPNRISPHSEKPLSWIFNQGEILSGWKLQLKFSLSVNLKNLASDNRFLPRLVPHVSMFHHKKKRESSESFTTKRKKNKFTRVIFRHDMARKVFALHNRSPFFWFFCKRLCTIHGDVFSKSVCHMFFLPFKWCVFWLFFPSSPGLQYTFFCESLKVVWRCSNICLVDSISFLLFSFLFRPRKEKRKKILARHSCNNTEEQKKSMQIVPARRKKKESRILSCGASFDNRTKCWNSFCQGNFAIRRRQCSVFPFFSTFYANAMWKNISSTFSRVFRRRLMFVVICSRTKFIASHCIQKLKLNFHLICVFSV